MRDEDLKQFESELDKFIKTKKKLLNKEMRDGGERGITWLKLRSPPAILRTLCGIMKNSDHQSAQINRLDALTYENYLRNRLCDVNEIESKEQKKAALFVLRNNIAIQYEHFAKVDPKGQYKKILQHALGSDIKPYLDRNRDIAQKQKQFYLLWPLYVRGKHEESYLNKPQFSADNAFLCYLNKVKSNGNLLKNYLTVEIFKEIFRDIKGPKREPIIQNPVEGHGSIDLNEIIKQQGLKEKKLSANYRWADKNMGMELNPKRLEEFKINSISANGHVYGKPNKAGEQKQLKDGWYQYIILAQDAPKGSGIYKHDMRYFPCVTKPVSQCSNGSSLPYKKYVAHSEIAGGFPVYASGAFKIENGVITLLDDSSGHYKIKNQKQKKISLEYAKQKLCQLGLNKDRAESLIVKIMPEMSIKAKKDKLKKKITATTAGIFSTNSPGLSTRCENRPPPPKKLRNLDPDHQIRSPCDEKVEESFDEKLKNFVGLKSKF